MSSSASWKACICKLLLRSALAVAALLLALNPLALQAHVAFEEGSPCLCKHYAVAVCEHGKQHSHDSKSCPVCQLLGLLASTQFDLEGSSQATPFCHEVICFKPKALMEMPACMFFFSSANPRAPPSAHP